MFNETKHLCTLGEVCGVIFRECVPEGRQDVDREWAIRCKSILRLQHTLFHMLNVIVPRAPSSSEEFGMHIEIWLYDQHASIDVVRFELRHACIDIVAHVFPSNAILHNSLVLRT